MRGASGTKLQQLELVIASFTRAAPHRVNFVECDDLAHARSALRKALAAALRIPGLVPHAENVALLLAAQLRLADNFLQLWHRLEHVPAHV